MPAERDYISARQLFLKFYARFSKDSRLYIEHVIECPLVQVAYILLKTIKAEFQDVTDFDGFGHIAIEECDYVDMKAEVSAAKLPVQSQFDQTSSSPNNILLDLFLDCLYAFELYLHLWQDIACMYGDRVFNIDSYLLNEFTVAAETSDSPSELKRLACSVQPVLEEGYRRLGEDYESLNIAFVYLQFARQNEVDTLFLEAALRRIMKGCDVLNVKIIRRVCLVWKSGLAKLIDALLSPVGLASVVPSDQNRSWLKSHALARGSMDSNCFVSLCG